MINLFEPEILHLFRNIKGLRFLHIFNICIFKNKIKYFIINSKTYQSIKIICNIQN